MDNITHTLIGITLGCAAERDGLPSRKEAIFAAVLSSNFPDIDVLSRIYYWGDPIGSLLHHRGYTHTIVAAPVFAFVSALLASLAFHNPQLDGPPDQAAVLWRLRFKRLFWLGVLGALLHVFADSWNDYGVHPFSPFSNRWFYGDFMFILEPMLWLSMLPLVFFAFSGRIVRITAVILELWLLVMAYAASASSPGLTVLALASFALLVGGFQVLGLKWFPAPDPRSAVPAIVGVLATIACFFVGSRAARERVLRALAEQNPHDRVIQLSSAPFPGNPWLWRAIAVSSGRRYSYRARLATVSLAPSWFETPGEFMGVRAGRTAPLADAELRSEPNIHWIGEFEGSIIDLASLSFKDCGFAELLKFARVPFWTTRNGQTIVGDLRYDLSPGLNFSKFVVSPEMTCPGYHAPWDPPIQFPEGQPLSN